MSIKPISIPYLFVILLFFAVSCDVKKKSMNTKEQMPQKVFDPIALGQNKVSVTNKTLIYLPFDQQENGSFKNEKDLKNPGTICNKITLHDGLFGKAMRTEENAYVGISKQHTFSRILMVEFWIKRGKTSTKTTLLETFDNKEKYGWKLELLPEQQKNLLVWSISHPDGTSSELISSKGLNDPEKWYRITLTWGSIYGGQKALRIHIDGSYVAEKPNYKLMKIAKGQLKIKSPENGLIDDFAISADSPIIFRDIKDVKIPIQNLDFEQQDKGWIGVYDNLVIDAKEKHSGKYSLKIETDDLYTREYLSPLFSVKPDAVYRISFWAKLDRFVQGYSAIGVWIRWYFAPEETCSIGGDFVANFTLENKEKKFGWRKFSAEVAVPRKKFYRKKIKWARLQVKNYHSQVLVWIDDIEVEEVKSEEIKPSH